MGRQKSWPEPETRYGHCCGCGAYPVTLFRVAESRYRCETCAAKEAAGIRTQKEA